MKYLIAFLAGAGAGVIGTYLYFRNRIDTIVKETVNEEMERFFVRQEKMMSPPDVEEISKEEEEKEVVSDKPETNEKTSIVEMENIIRTNYRCNDGDEEDDDDEEYISDEEMAVLIKTSQERMSEAPRIISEDEHTTTCIGYDCEEYIWYEEENFVTDSLDNRVEEPDSIFCVADWREQLKGKESIIIRVPGEATDYVIYNDKGV